MVRGVSLDFAYWRKSRSCMNLSQGRFIFFENGATVILNEKGGWQVSRAELQKPGKVKARSEKQHSENISGPTYQESPSWGSFFIPHE